MTANDAGATLRVCKVGHGTLVNGSQYLLLAMPVSPVADIGLVTGSGRQMQMQAYHFRQRHQVPAS